LTDRNIYTWKFKNACLNADKIIATSNQTKLDIIKYFNISENKINVVYQSCNKIFESIANEEQKIEVRKKYNLPSDFILTVGTIERRKNALNVLKALYYFNLDIHYVIIGRSTKYTEEIISFAKEHKIENQITILNGVHTEDLPAIYQMSRIFVYPSIYEGFGIPIIEAFNSKVPIITSNTGSTAEISGDAAVQVDPLNSKNIGIAIKSILESNDLSEQLIQQGLNRAKLFDQKIVCNNIMNIYKGL
jgi:glycosyltransferase involved in cell wall biosynthesis